MVLLLKNIFSLMESTGCYHFNGLDISQSVGKVPQSVGKVRPLDVQLCKTGARRGFGPCDFCKTGARRGFGLCERSEHLYAVISDCFGKGVFEWGREGWCGGGGVPPKIFFLPKSDEKNCDLDIFGVLKMSKNGFHGQKFGNATFSETDVTESGGFLGEMTPKTPY